MLGPESDYIPQEASVSSLRTPVVKTGGQFGDAHPEQLLYMVLRATLERLSGLDPFKVEDVVVDVVLSELGGSKASRMAMNHAGTGAISVGIGAGMESMSRNYGSRAIPTDLWSELAKYPVSNVRDCIMPMGISSKNVARRYRVSRDDQDLFALGSHLQTLLDKKAREATKEEQVIHVSQDDGIRPGINAESLAKLKPVFAAEGASMAGNSS
ncbi:hypothetical protein DL765_004081 [Monosporascus sp. GIB2]|nr:hypothetical protein DL765_004081 [Monosporascus sp. GIB2]